MKNSNDCKSARKSFVSSHIQSLPKSGIREFFDLVTTMPEVISLGVGEPDFVTPWTVRENAIFSLEKGHTSYTSNYGLLSLRKEICSYLAANYNLDYRPESECLVTVGVSEALDLAMRAIVEPGDEILYTEPCFVAYPAEIKMARGIPVALETFEENEFSLSPEDLEKKITPKTKALLINFPCNPTGAVLSPEQMQAIADLVIKHDILLITDEIYSELTYSTRYPSIASLPGMKERTIFLHGFSKAFAMTGFRVGYACGPKDIIDAMMKIHQYSMMCASITSQEAALEALRHGQNDMEKMRKSYLQRRNLIVKGFRDIGLPCVMPQGAFYVFPKISSTGLSSHDFARQLLLNEKVAVVPGSAFGACGEGFVRCSYAASVENITEALRRIGHFLENLTR